MAEEKKKTPVKKKTTTTKKTVAKKKAPAKKTPVRKKTVSTAKRVSTASAKIEKQFDEAMSDTQKLIDKKVSTKTKKTVRTVTKKAEAFAWKVEHLGEEVESLTDSVFPSTSGTKAAFHADYSSKISRLFIFRFLWMMIEGPIIAVRSLWICIITVIHWVTMFLSWKRNKKLWAKQQRFWNHIIQWKSYMNWHTDARPEIITH